MKQNDVGLVFNDRFMDYQIYACPRCLNKSALFSNKEKTCLYCGHVFVEQEYTGSYQDSFNYINERRTENEKEAIIDTLLTKAYADKQAMNQNHTLCFEPDSEKKLEEYMTHISNLKAIQDILVEEELNAKFLKEKEEIDLRHPDGKPSFGLAELSIIYENKNDKIEYQKTSIHPYFMMIKPKNSILSEISFVNPAGINITLRVRIKAFTLEYLIITTEKEIGNTIRMFDVKLLPNSREEIEYAYFEKNIFKFRVSLRMILREMEE